MKEKGWRWDQERILNADLDWVKKHKGEVSLELLRDCSPKLLV